MYKAFKASHPESKRQATLSEYLLILQKLMSSLLYPLSFIRRKLFVEAVIFTAGGAI
jgi:hypothetical protein